MLGPSERTGLLPQSPVPWPEMRPKEEADLSHGVTTSFSTRGGPRGESSPIAILGVCAQVLLSSRSLSETHWRATHQGCGPRTQFSEVKQASLGKLGARTGVVLRSEQA